MKKLLDRAQQSLVQPPFTPHGGLASSSGAAERQFLNQGIRVSIRETHVGGASRVNFVQQIGQGQHFPDESNHHTGTTIP